MGKRQKKAAKRASQKFQTNLNEMEIFAEEREIRFKARLKQSMAAHDLTLLNADCRMPDRKLNLMWIIEYGYKEGDAVLKKVSVEFPRGTRRFDDVVEDMVLNKVIQHSIR